MGQSPESQDWPPSLDPRYGVWPPDSAVSPCLLQRVRWARALYDFEAMEVDELGLRCGEVVEVLDSSNPSWWTGRLHNKLGLFPANYVAPLSR